MDAGIYNYSINAKIAYDKKNDEVILTNSAYDYCYVFNIPKKSWYKLGDNYTNVFNIGNDSFLSNRIVSDGGMGLYDLLIYKTGEEFESSVKPVLWDSRAMNLGISDYKKIKRVAIRGYFKPEEGELDNLAGTNKFIGAYLWVSKDGNNFTLLELIQFQDAHNDIIFKRLPITVKYFVVVVCGHMTSDSYISHLDIDYDPAYDNKLR